MMPSTVFGAEVELELTDSRVIIEGRLSAIDNAYPGYQWPVDLIYLRNKSSYENVQVRLEVDSDGIIEEYLEGDIKFTFNQRSVYYPINELNQGVEITLLQNQLLELATNFTLAGERMNNFTQNQTSAFAYRFIITELEHSTVDFEVQLPKTGEQKPSYRLLGALIVISCLFLVVCKRIVEYKNF